MKTAVVVCGVNDSIVGSSPMYPCVVIAQSDMLCYQVGFNNRSVVEWLIYVSLLDNFHYDQTMVNFHQTRSGC